jgi:proton-coupled amino acid transporter
METENKEESGTQNAQKEDKKLLSNTMVYFTLMKGFVGAGILYLPE